MEIIKVSQKKELGEKRPGDKMVLKWEKVNVFKE